MNVFFDLDGTLVDVSARHHATYAAAVEALGGTPLPLGEYWALKREATPHAAILERSGLRAGDEPEFLRRFIGSIERAEGFGLVEVITGAREALAALRDAGHALFLVSLRRDADNLRAELRELGLDACFTEIGSGHEEGQGADVTRAGIVAALVARHPAARTLMVGDTESDVMAARTLGVPVVAVLSGIRSRRLLEEQAPDYVLDDVTGLPSLVESLDRGDN